MRDHETERISGIKWVLNLITINIKIMQQRVSHMEKTMSRWSRQYFLNIVLENRNKTMPKVTRCEKEQEADTS